ncbi:MAG: hypothetical protein K2R98_12720 [Gemmataceae bacterium]|nr:hypothetical protein [Gemmataceae bacterium]
MASALILLLLVSGLSAGGEARNPVGFLYQPAYCCDQVLRGPASPYCPEPGDLVFCTDYTIFWCVTHDWAGAGHPHHSGIVVARPDGSLGVLEAGPYDTLRIRVIDIEPHFKKYTEMGEPIWIRKRRTPLTCEQSAALTAFAMEKEGKRFALIRQGAQLTGLRCRGGARLQFMGKPHPDRCAYFCSELATEALVAGRMIDPVTARPAATYPSDLFFDRSANKYINDHLNLSCDWLPPARWLGCTFPETAIQR